MRERKPVIHNDYASLKHKKGIPEGHAKIVRDLAVPVMREEKIVAILGVGNKLADYTEKDAETVDYLADVTWEIVARKREEEVRQESETLFRNLFQHHAAVKLIIDSDTGNIIDANQSAENYYGWSRKRLRQMRIQDINILSPEEVEREMEKARNQERVYFEFRHRRADGSRRDVEVFSSKIQVKGKDLLHSIVHDITERKFAETERERLIGELQDALSKVKLLSGFLPICASCKKIRNDKGYWQQIEAYIRDHSEAQFSHGICPDCSRRLYPDFYVEK
jgi:PAS domain S-box-containing protein